MSAVSPARKAASDVLLSVIAERAFATPLLASERISSLSREDRGLTNELVLGVLRWQRQLDFLIERYSNRALEKIDLKVLIALRLAIYQLRFLTRIPAHAAINEAVNLVRDQKLKSAAPFANAVLRAAQREQKTSIRSMLDEQDTLTSEAIEVSLPEWLVRRWKKRFGDVEARELAIALNQTPRVAFRFNATKKPVADTTEWLKSSGIEFVQSDIAKSAFVVTSGSISGESEPVREGWLYLQDESSQLAGLLAGSLVRTDDERINFLDLCAAPGSKSTLIASILGENSLVVCCDLYGHRLRSLKSIAARLGARNIYPLVIDASKPLAFRPDAFDAVLVDAPCSGLGTLARHPEIKWRLEEFELERLAHLQSALLENAALTLKSGGILTYSVCSTEPEEGEEVIARFRASHTEFRDVTRERLVELGLDPQALLTSDFGARTFTHRHGSESFFFCVLWKRR